MYIVVTGGTGFIGTHLCNTLRMQGHKVVVVSFERNFQGINESISRFFSDCDVIIHLAGAPISHRWTKHYKQLILDSRVKTAEAIYNFLSKQQKRPQAFISASAVGFYGNREEEILIETSGPGTDFLASISLEWEKATEKFSLLGMRTLSLRMGAVLGRDGGILLKMLPIFRRGFGGKLGKGTQWFPWIHINDLVNIYAQAVSDPRFSGSINAVAPELVRNLDFTKTLGMILKKPTLFSIPSFILKLTLGEFATVLLSSQKVFPQSLENLSFFFEYPTLLKALEECRTY